MKRLLLVVLMACFSATTFAQLGKMQYEDAEEHFAAGKFKEALALLDESEKTLGKSNPMIEHLRIMARTELLKKDLTANIGQLEIAQEEAKDFLTKYDGDARIEDKYREVYKASKTLAAFPSKEEIAKQAAEKEKKAPEKSFVTTQSFLTGYRDGMTAEEAKREIPGFVSQETMDTVIMLIFNGFREVVFLSPRTNRAFGYSVTDQDLKSDKQCTESRRRFEQKKAELTRVLGVGPDEKPEQSLAGKASGDATAMLQMLQAYGDNLAVWTAGPKSISLTLTCVAAKRSVTSFVTLTAMNSDYYQ